MKVDIAKLPYQVLQKYFHHQSVPHRLVLSFIEHVFREFLHRKQRPSMFEF